MLITIEQAIDILRTEIANLEHEMLDHLVGHNCYFQNEICPEYARLFRLQSQWQQRLDELERQQI